jgi:lipopolysaccharide export LptBFGC system permease protein LptF
MSWARVYRLALHLLPTELRQKHGRAMQALFARELTKARTQGWLQGTLVGVAGLWDVVWRGAYEQRRTSVDPEGPPMQRLTTRQLLRRHAASFAFTFAVLTVVLLANFAGRQMPALIAPGAPASTVAEALLLAVPFTAALTIPMAVFVAVLWEFTRLGANGTLAAARGKRDGMRRLILPVLAAATGVAVISFVVTAQIVPRANERLVVVLAQHPTAPSDRAMTLAELRAAARTVRPAADRTALTRAARYEVEIQKKFALPAACVVLALVAIAVALSAPRGGAALVIAASLAVFGAYYVMLVTGESLANQLVISPAIAMWGANALLLTAALLAVSKRAGSVA